MPYRLYRRDPVKIGAWYYTVTCKGCTKPIYILDDPAAGKGNGVQLVGGGELSIPCARCSDDSTYPLSAVSREQSMEELPGAYPERVKISAAQRKLLWKTYPKARATFGVGYIEDRPLAAALVGRIITSWADVEVESARVLAELMGTNVPPAAAVFGALRSSRAQHDALVAAAEVVLDTKDLELFHAHMIRKAALEKERNDLAHGCFGVSVAIPDHIVWAAQFDYLLFSATNGDPESFRRQQFVYELGTLERIAQEIAEFYHQLGFFRGYLWARHDGLNGGLFRQQRYGQLCDQPHIKQAINKLKAKKKA